MLLSQLEQNLSERQAYLRADRNQHTIEIKTVEPRALLAYSLPHIVKGLERKASLVDLAVTAGRRVRQKLKLKRDSVYACQVGWFILVAFFETGVLSYRLDRPFKKNGKRSKYNTYSVFVKDRKALLELWTEVEQEENADLYPMSTPADPWVTGLHSTGVSLIKRANTSELKLLSPEAQPLVFQGANKLGATPWLINSFMLQTAKAFYEAEPVDGISPFEFKTTEEGQRKESLTMVADATLRLASKHEAGLVYHLYNFDFRGRVYNLTSYLHEQADDLAKSLLLHARGSELGSNGLYWLLLHTANSYGYDKVTLDERVDWCLQHYSELLSYGEDPVANQGWINADKSWSFLSACRELWLYQDWCNSGRPPESFVSNIVCYLDGSCNGLQHLTAMSHDQELAPYVNLIALDKPGDLYAYIAEKVWNKLAQLEATIPESTRAKLDYVLDEVTRLQEAYESAESGSELKAQAFHAVQEWRNNTRALRDALFSVYWGRITDLALRRKIVKRASMTLG